MASLCKSQQCSIERRGFRQELDSWRHKLIHCVGFETILEGLFGPALLDDLSLFKDCEPTGVCDWSFDENCLFCCLRREKVKEHLAGFHKPINEAGQENFLKQEQAKIIRLERQAEEFINAVFYKKDSPRISDPNIPLVAREIMQRMIRQFAAEYTSKNSSTQDSSPPNSTKNQSLPKSPSGQSSPPPATTQNPVLSKLLMADQDSPLDLTVKKPHLEEPCEQADGVLDLSTKKSPCSGSPNSSISPSTSNNIGNGSRDTEKKAIDPNNSSLSLEMFMAKLCSHHQKQFILVLNNLCTEESIMKSKSRSASVSKIESHDNIDVSDHSCSDKKADLSLVAINKSNSGSCLNCQVSINTPTNPQEDSYHSGKSHCSGYLSKVPISSDYKEDHVNNISHATDQTIIYNPFGISTTEEKRGAAFAKISDVSQTVFLEHCVLANSNSSLNILYDSSGSELSSNNPEIANKENTQLVTPKQTHLDCTDCNLKQENSATTGTAKKLENHYESPFQDLADHSTSSLQKIKLHENKRLKNVKCKNTRVLTTNDCDSQCDVVYISEPVTTECHFENHKSVGCPRNTARKSTRGYLFSGNCCELSTVRTLVRSSKVEDQGNAALHTSEALIFPNGLIQTLPSTDILSLIHVEEKTAEMDTLESIPQTDEMPETTSDSSRNSEKENCEQSLKMAEEPVKHNSDSMIPVFSSKQNESEKTHVLSNHAEMAHDEHDEIPKMKLNSVASTDANSSFVNDLEKSVANLATDPIFDVSHSNNSCHQEDSSGTPSLDMEVIVSLKNNHVLSQSTPESSPHDALMEDASATLQYSHASLSTTYSSSFLSRAADKNLSYVGSSSVDANILPENTSDGVITDHILSSDQHLIEMSSESVPKENFESQISKTLQDDLSSSDMIKLKDTTQGLAKENVDFIDVKTENVTDGQSIDLNDSVKMTEIVVPENIGLVQPILDALHCPTPDALRSSEHFHSPLNTCTKIVGNITVKLEANGSNEDLNHCGNVSSSECSKNYTFEKPLKIEVVNGESKLDDSLDKIDNSLVYKKTPNRRLTPIKRHKKASAPTDRCLRSHEAPADPPFHKSSSIQVLISGAKETNAAQRFVELRAEDAPHSSVIHSLVDEAINDENYFATSINGHCQEGKPLLCKNMLKMCSSPFKMSKSLTICFETDSNKRMVSFARENNHNCRNMVKTEHKCSAASLRNTSQLHPKCKKEMLENFSNSISQTKSSNKQITANGKMNYCKSGKLQNLSTENKQINDCNNQISRPNFLDWCSEEENQERISSFNEKYTTIHKNWIPLEREMGNVIKSKNKSDKLKEIWKTKKRVRRPKSIQDAPKCSPVQMLFMNSFKLSDICEWFMETTETKSLVIVKKINTRLPEEHQLPMIQSPKYSSQSLYPHILQAQRLKKHLKKFASVCPARNDLKTPNSLNTLIGDSSAPLDQVSKDTVKGPNDCQMKEPHDQAKKTVPVHLLKKDNRLREDLKYKSCTSKNNLCMVANTKKVGNAENSKEIFTSESSLPKVPNFRKLKNQKNRKRSKNDSPIESIPRLTKKRKIEAKRGLIINSLHVNKNVSPKTKVSKLSKTDVTSNSQAPKKQVGKADVFKTRLRKGKAKTPMQKQSLKSQFVQKRKTRSANLRPISPNFSDSAKITSLSSSHRKKELRKICTVSGKNKINVAPQVRQRKERSQQEPSTRKRRSLEFK